jgi:hypothetical protein
MKIEFIDVYSSSKLFCCQKTLVPEGHVGFALPSLSRAKQKEKTSAASAPRATRAVNNSK